MRKVMGYSALYAARLGSSVLLPAAMAETSGSLPFPEGYQGIWYSNEASKDEYKFKYSGGFATYPQQHIPIAIYRREVNRTFFCYGGTVPGKRELHLIMDPTFGDSCG